MIDEQWIGNDMEESAVAWFKVLSWHLYGVTGETTNNLGQLSRFSGRHLNPRSPEYKEIWLITRASRSVEKVVMELLNLYQVKQYSPVPAGVTQLTWVHTFISR
jgi:hypothetical protein